MRAISLLLVLPLAFASACQSGSKPPKRSMYIAAVGFRGKLQPKEEFKNGESPRLVLHGYGNETVVFEVERNGQLVSRDQVKVPPPRVYERDAGVQFEKNLGQIQPVHQTELVRTGHEIIYTLKPPPPGLYQVTLKLNGVPVEAGRFSVLANPAK